MSNHFKKFLTILLVMLVVASIVLLVTYGAGGGSCNGGLAIIFLSPIIIIIGVIQLIIFRKLTFDNMPVVWGIRILSFSLTLGWIYLTKIFSEDEPTALIYMMPFLAFNVTLLVTTFIKLKPIAE
jgi:hypothetical protein